MCNNESVGKIHINKYLANQCKEVFIIWLVVLIIPFTLDFIHNQTIIECDFLDGIIRFIRKPFYFIGISYSNFTDFISSGGSIILSIVTTVLSNEMGVVKRSEETLFGIPKKNLKFLDKRFQDYNDKFRRAVYAAPIIMIIVIIAKYSLTGVFVLFCGYLCMIVQFYIFAVSYNFDKQKSAVIQYLLEQNMNNYCNALEGMSKYFRNTDEWTLAESIWQLILNRINDIPSKTGLKPYYIARKYYEKIFILNMDETERQFFNQLQWCECNCNAANKKNTADMILRGVLDAVIPNIKGDNLESLLIHFSDFLSRWISLAADKEVELTENQMQKESMWMAVLLSVKLRKDKEIKSRDAIQKIMDKVSSISYENMENLLSDEYWNLEGMAFKEKESNKREIDDLLNEYKNRFFSMPCLLNFWLCFSN